MKTNITDENLEIAGLSMEDFEVEAGPPESPSGDSDEAETDDYAIRTTTDETVISGGAPSPIGSGGSVPRDDQQDGAEDDGVLRVGLGHAVGPQDPEEAHGDADEQRRHN